MVDTAGPTDTQQQPHPIRKILFITSIVILVIIIIGGLIVTLATLGGLIAHIVFFSQAFANELTYQGFFFSFGEILYDACIGGTIIAAIVSSIILVIFTAKQMSDSYRTLIVAFCFTALGLGFYWVAFFYSLSESIRYTFVNGFGIPMVGSTFIALLLLFINLVLCIIVAVYYSKFEIVPEPSLIVAHENTHRIMMIGCSAATGVSACVTLFGTLVYLTGCIVILALNVYTDATTQIICYILYLLSIPLFSIVSPVLITVGTVVKQIPNKHGTNMRHSAFVMDLYSMASCFSLCFYIGTRVNFVAPFNAGYIVAFCGLLIMLIGQLINLTLGIVVEVIETVLRKKYGPQGIPKVETQYQTTVQIKVEDASPQIVTSHEKLSTTAAAAAEAKPNNVIGLASVLYDYVENDNPDQYMSVSAGDTLDILQKYEDGWFLCRKGNREGLVPSNYLKEL